MTNPPNTFTFIDLFAGIGGFRAALEPRGGDCIGFSEINKDAISVYCDNFNETPKSNFGNIKDIQELPRLDLLTAGVPCQSWSIAGKNLGFDDDRGQLWNDTLYLLQQAKPKAFIFENVKGLADPRNKSALSYILTRIKQAGYYAKHYVINSHEYGIPQSRVRIYIIGFREEHFSAAFTLPQSSAEKITLADVLRFGGHEPSGAAKEKKIQKDLFGNPVSNKSMSLASRNGYNSYFLFNDLRNGHTTVHSWDIIDTTERQKDICHLLLRNRRKSAYGNLDGNPLSLKHFRSLDTTISERELTELVCLGILKVEEYRFAINQAKVVMPSETEKILLACAVDDCLVLPELKSSRAIKLKKIPIYETLETLKEKNILDCQEMRYDFKNTKISTGLLGVNRIFLPSSDIFPTLVASDTNDYVALKDITPTNHEDYKRHFIEEIYKKKNYRKITKHEACLLQGFPGDFKLPEVRARWMKLLGNSVAIPVIDALCRAMMKTGVFTREIANSTTEQEPDGSPAALRFNG